jgi:dTDP-4-dehydrorhamnose reductase
MKSVLVLGGTGMLGSMLTDELSCRPGLRLSSTYRDSGQISQRAHLPGVTWVSFDAGGSGLDRALAACGHHEWIINAIGITKPLIQDDDAELVERAVRINVTLPHEIARFAANSGARVLQIATDCVYSGIKGNYGESDLHDALDVYGKTKSLGECYAANVAHLRCSIIGPEPKDFKFLIEWFRLQKPGAQVNGFVNHQWNGITTLHFARLCAGIIENGIELPHLQHVVPNGVISKAQMLHEFALAYRRTDVQIQDTIAAKLIDRTLSTSNLALNQQLWQAAGYQVPPAVPEMIAEVASYSYRFNNRAVA